MQFHFFPSMSSVLVYQLTLYVTLCWRKQKQSCSCPCLFTKGASWWQGLEVLLKSTRPQAKLCRGHLFRHSEVPHWSRPLSLTWISLSAGRHHVIAVLHRSLSESRFLQTVECEPLLSVAYWFNHLVKPCWNILPLHSPLLRLGEYCLLKFKIISKSFPGCGLSACLYICILIYA